MYSVSILIPMNDNYLSNRICLETNINRTGIMDCQIIVYNNGSDKQIKDWCINELGSKVKYMESYYVKPNSDCLNAMLQEVDRSYIVIIPEPTILAENWLIELVGKTESIFNSGVVAIRTNNNTGSLTSKLTNYDEQVYVFQQENNLVNGVICFYNRYLEVIGGFDNTLNSGFEYLNYSYRLSMLGFWNYYISGMVGTTIKEYEPLSIKKTTSKEFLDSCKELIDAKKSITIKFRPESPRVNSAYKNLTNLIVKLATTNKQPFFNKMTNVIGVEVDFLTQTDIFEFTKFSNDNGLKCELKPVRDIKRIAINFFDNGEQ